MLYLSTLGETNVFSWTLQAKPNRWQWEVFSTQAICSRLGAMHRTPLAHLISPNTHAPCQHPSSNTGCYPWLCCQKIIFRGSLICDPENLNVGVILPKGTFDQQVKGVGRSRSQHSCSRGVQCRGAFKISPWVWAPVARNANRLVITSFTGLTFSTSSLCFLESLPKETSCTWSFLVSVCFQGTPSSLGWMLLPPGFTHAVPSVPLFT